MAKRKRNQKAALVKNQTDAPSPSKKVKVAGDTPQKSTPPGQQAGSESRAASTNSKHQSVNTPSAPAGTEPAGTSVVGKAALKRERQRKAKRETKKSSTTSKAAGHQEPQTESEKIRPEQQKSASGANQQLPSATQHDRNNAEGKVRETNGSLDEDASKKPSDTTKRSLPRATQPSKLSKGEPSVKKAIDPPGNSTTKAHVGGRGEAEKKPSKKRLRRQRAHQAKQGAASKNDEQHTPLLVGVKVGTGKQAKSSASTAGPPESKTSLDASLLHGTTKTSLLPRPVKEWIEQDDMDHNNFTNANIVSVRNAPRSDILDPLAQTLQDTSDEALMRSTQPSSKPIKNQSADLHNEIADSFAVIGVPSSTQEPTAVSTSLTRPGINTIASFSLSSRRHPPSVLAKRTASSLSGMRMDTGMIGSSPKPISANKATSVPSHSSGGDAKAAFERFNKFAHGGNSSESEDDSDDSDDSDSGSDADTKDKTTTVDAIQFSTHDARNASESSSSSVSETNVVGSALVDSTDMETGTGDETKHAAKLDTSMSEPFQGTNTGLANEDAVDVGGASAENSKGEDETMAGDCPIETADTPMTNQTNDAAPNATNEPLVQPSSNAPRMPGENDLPLFSEFDARHNMTTTDTALERSATFLGRELGGGLSGFGQVDDLNVGMGYIASQDADELYRSVDDISREVFGSTREIPDCKPLSHSLDVATEPLVTDSISGHGLGRKSAELETTDKTTSPKTIPRGSSPVVLIEKEMDSGASTAPSNTDDETEEQEENGDEYRQYLDSNSLATAQEETPEQYNSPPSSMSTLTSPLTSQEGRAQVTSADGNTTARNVGHERPGTPSGSNSPVPVTRIKKRKLTGTTSKHFSLRKPLTRAARAAVKSKLIDTSSNHDTGDQSEPLTTSSDSAEESNPQRPNKRKGHGETSALCTPIGSPAKTDDKKATPLPKTPRPPAGTSTCPVPSTSAARFGLIQEKLWDQPFWLIIAVTFLNKTTGRAAAPIFWSLKELYPTPEALSQAKQENLVEMIGTLGLQNQRAKRLISISKAWLENPPAKFRRFRTLHYPAKGDGKAIKKDEIVEEDANDCEGALEIGHIPGCGPYAWDSWRIFCRDVQRGLAEDYNGRGGGIDFMPEWQRVVPLDKELRACLRWMWLREGFVWSHEDGSKKDATVEEMDAGLKGEMEIVDERERKFAVEAASVFGGGVGGKGTVVKDKSGDEEKGSVAAEKSGDEKEGSESNTALSKKAPKSRARSRNMSVARRELDVESGGKNAVSTLRRSRRHRAA
jgi:hypothetical protein